MNEVGRKLEERYFWSPQLGPALARSCGALFSTLSYRKATTTAPWYRQISLSSLSLTYAVFKRPKIIALQVFALRIVVNMVSETSVYPFRICESLLTSPSKASFSDMLYMFFALYLTTLFSLDTWAAARNSSYRRPGNNSFHRPISTPPAPDSYQGGMHGRGNAGPSSGSSGNGGNVGRVPQARDSRPPMKLWGTAACGACMT